MQNDIAHLIRDALGNDKVTTKEASRRLEEQFGYRCPDDLAKSLMKLRRVGKVKGEISMESGGWIWWADGECRSTESAEED